MTKNPLPYKMVNVTTSDGRTGRAYWSGKEWVPIGWRINETGRDDHKVTSWKPVP